MDPVKIGRLIRTLRQGLRLTQKDLAARVHVSDKAVSKWERGLGCPDLSLLPALSVVLGVDLERLLAGELDENEILGGNMKKLKFYVCPSCGNVVTAMTDTAVSCCGKRLQALEPRKAADGEKLSVEHIENEYFITSDHEMTKEHYIAFVALLTGDRMLLCKQYPEWDLQTRLPGIAHGKLIWYCTQHGLFYQLL